MALHSAAVRIDQGIAGTRHWAAAGGVAIILVLASGIGLGFAAVVEHLTTPPTVAVTSPIFASQAQLPPWVPHVADRKHESSELSADTARDELQLYATPYGCCSSRP